MSSCRKHQGTRFVRLLVLAGAASISYGPTVHAADVAESSGLGPARLDEVTVTADRADSYSADLIQAGSFRGARQLDTPLTVDVVTDRMIEAQQDQSILDALRNTAGVSPAQTSVSVYSNIAIRGVPVENRGNYRLDGILPVVNLIDLPLEDKDRVEVLKGASALYYGFTTPAGIVNLTMKRPPSEPMLAMTVFGNSFGALAGHLDAGATWGWLGTRLNALYGSVDSGIDHTRGQRSLLSGAFDLKPTDSLRLSLDIEDIRKTVNEPGIFHYVRLPAATVDDLYPALQLPPLLDPSINFGPTWAQNRAVEDNLLASAVWNPSQAWSVSVSYGSSHLSRDRRFSTLDLNHYGPGTDGEGLLSIGLQPGATYDNSTYRAETALALDWGFTRHQLLLGASQNIRDSFVPALVPALCPGVTPGGPSTTCMQNAFDPVPIPEIAFSPPTGPKTRINDIGYYLFDRAELGPWVEALAGVRDVDYSETNLTAHQITFESKPVALSYGALVKPVRWASIYGTYIDGLESTPAPPAAAANSGATLPPTTSTQHELGAKVEPRKGLLFDAAYFDLQRASAYVNAADVYVLDGRARYRGVEFSMTGEVTADWSVYLSGQSLDARQISGAATLVSVNAATGLVTVVPTVVGRQIENAPRQTWSFASEYRIPGRWRGLTLSGAAYYISSRAVNQYNQAFIPGYSLFDAGVAWESALDGHPLTLRLNAQNIADKRYFSATGGGYIAQGPPRLVKFLISTTL